MLPAPGSLEEWADTLVISGGMTSSRAELLRRAYSAPQAHEMIIVEAATELQQNQHKFVVFPRALYEGIRKAQAPQGLAFMALARSPAGSTLSAASAGFGYGTRRFESHSAVTGGACGASSKGIDTRSESAMQSNAQPEAPQTRGPSPASSSGWLNI